MSALLTDAHRAWIGKTEEPVTVEVSRRDIIKYSVATEQIQHKYLVGDEAPPMFVFNLFGPLSELQNLRTDGLPKGQGLGLRLPLRRVMAGGTELRPYRAICPGDRLIATRRITDLYEKQGSTGPLIFTVRTLNITNEAGEPVLDEIQTSINR